MASHIAVYHLMGPKRELKLAKKSFWDGKSSAEYLQKVAADLQVRPAVKLSYASHNAVTEYEAKAEIFSANAAALASRKSSPQVTNETVQKAAAALKKLNLPTIGSFPQTMELSKVLREYIAIKVSEDDYDKAIKEDRKVIFYANAAAQASRKSSPRGQRCGGPKLFVFEETKGDRDPIDNTEDEIGKSPPAISRSSIPKTMRVKIMVKSQSHGYTALIDTGSTYNVVHPRVAREVGLKIINDDPIKVSIADGSIMCSEGSCPEFKFVIQGGQFATPAYILQLGGFDVILGIQWLRGLGQINWDFASLKMEFTQGDRTIQIKGIDTEESEEGCSTDEKLVWMVREGVKYGAGIVYDIHSPRVPSTEEIADGINKMLAVLQTIQVNPDGGLKNKLLRSQLVSAK